MTIFYERHTSQKGTVYYRFYTIINGVPVNFAIDCKDYTYRQLLTQMLVEHLENNKEV